jgi:3-isopropylmalate dehydrogenase
MLLRTSLGLNTEAAAVEQAVSDVLKAGLRTRDIGGGDASLSTTQMGDAVLKRLQAGG